MNILDHAFTFPQPTITTKAYTQHTHQPVTFRTHTLTFVLSGALPAQFSHPANKQPCTHHNAQKPTLSWHCCGNQQQQQSKGQHARASFIALAFASLARHTAPLWPPHAVVILRITHIYAAMRTVCSQHRRVRWNDEHQLGVEMM